MKVFKYLLVFVSVLLFSSCSGMNSPQEIDWDKLDYYQELTAEEVQADIAQLIEKTESTHPYITMKDTPLNTLKTTTKSQRKTASNKY